MNMISRPVVTIVSSPSGKAFSFNVTHPSWNFDYRWLKVFGTKAEAQTGVKKFRRNFDAEAKDIESGKIGRYHIMTNLVEHGKVKSRRQLSARFTG